MASRSQNLIDEAIAEVLPSKDPLDDPNFDVTALLNKHFPSELSLSAVESHCERLALKMHSLDAQILQAVEQQSSAGSAAQEDLEVANSSVAKLMAHLSLIRSKALDTEHAVRDICSDIQTLDNAKRNLTSTITTLRRLTMLETAIQQLSILTEERGYREAANLLEATSQLAANFESYKAVPKVCELMASVRALRSQLQAQVFEEFKEHISVTMSQEVIDMLADAAQVVTVLGPTLVSKLTQWLCEHELAEYDTAFDPAKQAATLEGVERRYGWLRRWLRGYSHSFASIFPASWQLPLAIAEEFCVRSRNHLSTLLQVLSLLALLVKKRQY
jgi:hypothetical protein